MTDWYDEVRAVLYSTDSYKRKNTMSYFYSRGVQTRLKDGKNMPATILAKLYTTDNLRNELIKQVSIRGLRQLSDNEVVSLWMMIPEVQQYIDISKLSVAARTFIFVNDVDAFREHYDPNESKDSDNKCMLDSLKNVLVFNEFMAKMSDEKLAALIHKYPLLLSETITKFRINKSTKHGRRLIRIFDCSQPRNQSWLRALIVSKPWMMERQTLEQMERSSIPRQTWARLIAEVPVDKRRFFPVGVAEWAKKGIFVKNLKGKRFKPFPDFATGTR